MARMASISPAERASVSQRALALPMPCSDPMLPPRLRHQLEHGAVDSVVLVLEPEHVHVQVALPQMAEDVDGG